MSKKDIGKDLLENAYKLQSPDDNIAYYDKMADSYDHEFADSLGYALPQAIAESYQALRKDSDTPVIDVGCGTGLLADSLADQLADSPDRPDLVIDGLDISDAMLDAAKNKKRYRNLRSVDLTKPIDPELKNYGAVLSSGTFTHGHLGPDAMVRLLDVAVNNGLFILSINKEHYTGLGFESVIKTLVNEKRIGDLLTKAMNIYSTAGHEHSDDIGVIVSFRKRER